MSDRKPTLSQQITAARLGRDMIAGRTATPKRQEREHIGPHADAAVHSLEWLRDNGATIRKGRDALALLRRRLPDLPADMREEVVTLLRDAEPPARERS